MFGDRTVLAGPLLTKAATPASDAPLVVSWRDVSWARSQHAGGILRIYRGSQREVALVELHVIPGECGTFNVWRLPDGTVLGEAIGGIA